MQEKKKKNILAFPNVFSLPATESRNPDLLEGLSGVECWTRGPEAISLHVL